MPWQEEPKKDVVDCDKPRGEVKHSLIRGCPNGETYLDEVEIISSRPSVINLETGLLNSKDRSSISRVDSRNSTTDRAPGELKHLSTQRKRNQQRFR